MPTARNLDMEHDQLPLPPCASAPIHMAPFHHVAPDLMDTAASAAGIPTADRTPGKRPASAALAEGGGGPPSRRRRELVPCL